MSFRTHTPSSHDLPQQNSRSRVVVTVKDLQKKKQACEKIVATTCYDYSMARVVSETAVDLVLVGDSLGSVMLGYPSTIPVTMEHMTIFAAAVSRGLQTGSSQAFLLCDLPFLSYQPSLAVAFDHARNLMQNAGVQGLKIEGASKVALETTRAFVDSGICVMGHLGYTPQSEQALSKTYLQASTQRDAEVLFEQAKALESSGVFALVLEMVPTEVAALVTRELSIPVIGIGAGAEVDGQILVLQDLLGMNPGFQPRFLKVYGSVYENMREALKDYVTEVKKGVFPSKNESFFQS